jgi:serine/threonine protein kinase
MIVGETYSTPCDIWSLGCLAIELFTGSPPFSELSPMFAMFRIAETDDQVKPAPIPPEASKEFNSFLQYCLRRDPAHRGTAEQLKRHAFIRKYELLLPSFSGSSTSASTTLSSPTSILGTMSSSASGLSSVVRSGSPPSPPSSLRSSSQLDSHPSHDRRRNSF